MIVHGPSTLSRHGGLHRIADIYMFGKALIVRNICAFWSTPQFDCNPRETLRRSASDACMIQHKIQVAKDHSATRLSREGFEVGQSGG